MCPPPAVHEGSESCTPLARAALGARLQWVGDRVQQLQASGLEASREEPGVGRSPGRDWQWVGMGQGAVVIVVGELGREVGEVWREQTVEGQGEG